MKIELRKLSDIKPYAGNPRANDGAVDAVAASIRQFGFRQPIVVDGAGVIIAGHTRWKAAQKLGLKQVPVHVAKDLTAAQVRAYRLADNKTAELADWDLVLLLPELMAVKAEGADLLGLGWTVDELQELLAPAGTEGLTDEDAVPLPGDAAITQPGDLWVLGGHRLLCGDSSKAEDVDRLLAGRPQGKHTDQRRDANGVSAESHSREVPGLRDDGERGHVLHLSWKGRDGLRSLAVPVRKAALDDPKRGESPFPGPGRPTAVHHAFGGLPVKRVSGADADELEAKTRAHAALASAPRAVAVRVTLPFPPSANEMRASEAVATTLRRLTEVSRA